jgi:hypothetical protein
MQTLNRSFRLCESTLCENTRDVYGQELPVGNWKYTLTHDGQEDVLLEIKALNDSYSKWSPLKVNFNAVGTRSMNEREGQFSTKSEGEVKFIFSTTSNQQEIHYSCDVSPA